MSATPVVRSPHAWYRPTISPEHGVYVVLLVSFMTGAANELLTFAAVCLATPLAYAATVGTLSAPIFGLWMLNTLFFSSAIFTVKLRKPKTESVVPGLVCHAIASVIVVACWHGGYLGSMTAMAFGIKLLKFGFIVLRKTWYQTTLIQNVAVLETIAAFAFLVIAALSLLPAHLPSKV